MVNDQYMNNLPYKEDTVIMSNREKELQQLMNWMLTFCGNYGTQSLYATQCKQYLNHGY